jgi:hypothetical protein
MEIDMKYSVFFAMVLFQICCGSTSIDTWHVKPIATEKVIFTSPDPDNIMIATPGIVVCPNGRIVATIQVSGKGVKKMEAVRKGGRTFVYTSDDHGKTWQNKANVDVMHARPFIADGKLYIMGHMGDVRIARSEDWGNTWSKMVELTKDQKWQSTAANVWYKDHHIYLALEKRVYDKSDAWYGAELAPVLFRGNMKKNLLERENWTLSSAKAFRDFVNDRKINTLFGLPFYPGYYPDRYFLPDAGRRNASPMGWLETNVVQIEDPHHYFYDPNGNTFHLFMRASTGRTNIACVLKCVEENNGRLQTKIEKAPSGKDLLFTPMPGGHMRFHVLYDEQTELYWLLNTQATDSMTRAKYLPSERFGLADNERRRMQLHFSKNMFDWVFAGLVAVGPSEKQARHYASMAIDGDDLLILSRSGNENAESAHNGNIITFHKIKNFRRLVY